MKISDLCIGSVMRKSIRRCPPKYPDLIYIANSVIRVVGRENDDKRKDIPNFVNPKNVKVFDEHYYNSIEWACEQH